ncbi:hypothetical protein [Nonomuraea sp. SYSU D8015]|uniref:hypothetical protein n=1 Tax=Nonomuraea sp. SYSU D8015 TaxID=2593644 RepID=UPI001660F0FF|nr:hypothetical protein [Nonomuraea sp. SYSU D8015]
MNLLPATLRARAFDTILIAPLSACGIMSGKPAETTPGRARTFALAGQVLALGLIVAAMDRVAFAMTRQDILELFRQLRADGNMWLDQGAQQELLGFTKSGGSNILPFTIFCVIAALLHALAAIGLRRGSRGSTAAGLYVVGMLTPLYLVGLLLVSRWMEGGVLHDFMSSSDAEMIMRSSTPDWYAPARLALLGAAATAYVMTGSVLLRRAAPVLRDWTAPRRATLILGHAPLAGLFVAVFNFVALDQAHRLSDGKYYVRLFGSGLWAYVWWSAAAMVLVWGLTWIGRRPGKSHLLVAGLGAITVPFLLFQLVTWFVMYETMKGATFDDVDGVIGSGLSWYGPALITQASLAAVAFVAAVVLTLRAARRAPLP